MKVLITGAGGQVGRALVRSAPADVEVLAETSQTLDITDARAVNASIQASHPSLIINAAAYTAVDKAEDDRALATAVNVDGVKNLVDAANMVDARIVHISTDFVFDGERSSPYEPDHPAAPIGVYGHTKYSGEQHLRSADILVRTAWVYSADGGNFVSTMLRLMAERAEIGVVCDQIGTPTSADSLAAALWAFAQSDAVGIYHCTDSGVASWYDFAIAIRDEARAVGLLDDHAADSATDYHARISDARQTPRIFGAEYRQDAGCTWVYAATLAARACKSFEKDCRSWLICWLPAAPVLSEAISSATGKIIILPTVSSCWTH